MPKYADTLPLGKFNSFVIELVTALHGRPTQAVE